MQPDQSVATSHGPVGPSLVRLGGVAVTDAGDIAMASGFERTLPPKLIPE